MAWSFKDLFGRIDVTFEGELFLEHHRVIAEKDLDEQLVHSVDILDKLGKDLTLQDAFDCYMASRECAALDVFRIFEDKYWRKDSRGIFLYTKFDCIPVREVHVSHKMIRNDWDVLLDSSFVVNVEGCYEFHDFANLFLKDFDKL
ncbi:MAG: hypothetical protein GOU97_04990 [Nanoarchaeota archaeon]|nr:hypothetical protein [Nanoarchaeota archaeon]